MRIRLVPASAYPLDVLTAAYNRARSDYLVPMPMTPETLSTYNTRHSVDLSASWVAETEGELIAIGLLGVRGARAWLTRIGVVREVRQYGVGRALVEALLDSARASGVTSVQLEVISENAIAQRLFKAMAFSPVRRLLVLDRPAGFPSVPGPIPDRTLSSGEAAALAENGDRGYAPSWVEEPPSVRRARRLTGLALGDSAVLTGDDGTQLSPVVLCAADGMTGPGLLTALHQQRPERPARKENIPEDDVQVGWFLTAGYEVAFTRVEMARSL